MTQETARGQTWKRDTLMAGHRKAVRDCPLTATLFKPGAPTLAREHAQEKAGTIHPGQTSSPDSYPGEFTRGISYHPVGSRTR